MPGPKVVPLSAVRRVASPPERTDEELMLLVRAGSREAMAALAARYVGPLTSFCVKLTGDPGVGEDIVQEALLRLWARRAQWRPRGTVAALLYTTARNLCRNRARDVRRRGRWLVPEAGQLDVELGVVFGSWASRVWRSPSWPPCPRPSRCWPTSGRTTRRSSACLARPNHCTCRSRL